MVGYLELDDGTVLEGVLFGAEKQSDGEVVFSTGMTGYVESLTDPSFAGQILTFTFPLIGNYGVSDFISEEKHLMKNAESDRIQVRGVVVSSYSENPSHYQMHETFSSWLKREGVAGLWGIDTRALTQKLREQGTMRGRIVLVKPVKKTSGFFSNDSIDLVDLVSIKEAVRYTVNKSRGKHVVLIDCGVKHGIIRYLLGTGITITRIPWNANPFDFGRFDGVVCSNGPGDPVDCQKTVATIQQVITKGIPFLGVCLGHQLLSLAIGAKTYKLPYGHRGLNQPCQDIFTKRAYITSQNHGYAVDQNTIPRGFSQWFVNMNDGTNEGLLSEKQKIWSTQFHPEGHPGPSDTSWVFDQFVRAL